MPATITFDDGSGATASNPRVYTISDVMLGILEQFRLSITQFDQQQGKPLPVHANIPDMFKAFLNQAVMAPALNAFPPAEVLTARQAVADAQAALAITVAGTITGVLAG